MFWALGTLLLGGCPSSRRVVHHDDSDADGDADADGDGGTGLDAAPDGSPEPTDAGYNEPDVWVDPGCADAGPPPTDYQCDLYTGAPCEPGFGCYPFVFYPGKPCVEEAYGSVCNPAGAGVQDDFCDGTGECASGHACFQSGEGTRCRKLCPLMGPSGCPAGLVCSPTDVPEMGACV